MPPRYDLEAIVKPMRPGMGPWDAFLNGYKHGYQNKVTRGVNALTKGTEEFSAWVSGYDQGELDYLADEAKGNKQLFQEFRHQVYQTRSAVRALIEVTKVIVESQPENASLLIVSNNFHSLRREINKALDEMHDDVALKLADVS